MVSATDFDPFRIVLGLVDDVDTLVRIGNVIGLRFDLALSDRDAYTGKTRMRALQPRIMAAHEALDDQARLVAAKVAATALCSIRPASADAVIEALRRVGWELRDGDLVAGTPEIREMFFPKGSPWDAFVVFRDIFAEAQAELTIVDAYCNGSIFDMLRSRDLTGLHVRILCSQNARAVAAEAKAFVLQHQGTTVDVRQAKDFHDRFVIVDGSTCIHVGASIKDAGKTAFMISRVEDRVNRDALLTAVNNSWDAAMALA